MLMNGKEVNHLVIGGETFDKSYTMGRKAKVIRSYAPVGSIRKDGKIVSLLPGEGSQTMNFGDVVTVIAIYKNAAAILLPDIATVMRGSWISIDDIEFLD